MQMVTLPRRTTTATSLTMGEAMRKAMVTPTGTPASRKPMKKTTEEQEQKGVTAPRRTATT